MFSIGWMEGKTALKHYVMTSDILNWNVSSAMCIYGCYVLLQFIRITSRSACQFKKKYHVFYTKTLLSFFKLVDVRKVKKTLNGHYMNICMYLALPHCIGNRPGWLLPQEHMTSVPVLVRMLCYKAKVPENINKCLIWSANITVRDIDFWHIC